MEDIVQESSSFLVCRIKDDLHSYEKQPVNIVRNRNQDSKLCFSNDDITCSQTLFEEVCDFSDSFSTQKFDSSVTSPIKQDKSIVLRCSSPQRPYSRKPLIPPKIKRRKISCKLRGTQLSLPYELNDKFPVDWHDVIEKHLSQSLS